MHLHCCECLFIEAFCLNINWDNVCLPLPVPMSPESEFLLDTLVLLLPYLVIIFFVPVTLVVVRLVFKGACRNGPVQRVSSTYDNEFWAELDKIESQEQETSNLNLEAWLSPVADIHKSVKVEGDFCGICSVKFEPLSPMIVEVGDSDPPRLSQDNADLLPPSSPVEALPCNHVFHKDCATRWMIQNGSCPLCIRPTCTKELGF